MGLKKSDVMPPDHLSFKHVIGNKRGANVCIACSCGVFAVPSLFA